MCCVCVCVSVCLCVRECVCVVYSAIKDYRDDFLDPASLLSEVKLVDGQRVEKLVSDHLSGMDRREIWDRREIVSSV